MIIVTGANGQLGGAIVAQLLARLPADQIGISVVDPEKATALAEQGYGYGEVILPIRRPLRMHSRARAKC